VKQGHHTESMGHRFSDELLLEPYMAHLLKSKFIKRGLIISSFVIGFTIIVGICLGANLPETTTGFNNDRIIDSVVVLINFIILTRTKNLVHFILVILCLIRIIIW